MLFLNVANMCKGSDKANFRNERMWEETLGYVITGASGVNPGKKSRDPLL